MAKKYVQTKDGWFQVKEDTTEQDIDNVIKSVTEMLDTDYEYEAFQKYDDMAVGSTVVERTAMPELTQTDEELEAMVRAFNELEGIKEPKPRVRERKQTKDDKKKPAETKTQNKPEEYDWEKEANKAAGFAALIILGVVALLAGAFALVLYLTPLTMDAVAEWIAFGVIKIIYGAYQIFYNGCVWLFEFILEKCGGSF